MVFEHIIIEKNAKTKVETVEHKRYFILNLKKKLNYWNLAAIISGTRYNWQWLQVNYIF